MQEQRCSRARFVPHICVGGELCPTHASEADLALLRSLSDVQDDFLDGFDWAALAAGGGKGGTLLAFHKCRGKAFVVKELSPSDHEALLRLAPAYVVHATRHRDTLLAPFFAHFHRPSTGVHYVAMGSVLPAPVAAVAAASAPSVYDLKGTADDKTLLYEGEKRRDVHKRFFNVGMRVCDLASRKCCRPFAAAADVAADAWAPGRRQYAAGKQHARDVRFPLPAPACAWMCARLESDAAFLRRHNLMDYSLLVRTYRLPPPGAAADPALAAAHEAAAAAAAAASSSGRPSLATELADGTVWLVEAGIIDYLQEWTLSKRAARCLKCMERPPYKHKSTEPPPYYGDRFVRTLGKKFTPAGRRPGEWRGRFPLDAALPPTGVARRRASSSWDGEQSSPFSLLRAAIAGLLGWIARCRRTPKAEARRAAARLLN